MNRGMLWLEKVDEDMSNFRKFRDHWDQLKDGIRITVLKGIVSIGVYKFDSLLTDCDYPIAGACFAKIGIERKIPVIAVTDKFLDLYYRDKIVAKFILLHELAHHLFNDIDPNTATHTGIRNIPAEIKADTFAASILPKEYIQQVITYIEKEIDRIRNSADESKKRRVIEEYNFRKDNLFAYSLMLKRAR